MSDLAAALQVAIRTHADQRDKQGAPYLLHVLRVVEAVSDEAKVVAALHDVLEDGELNLEELEGEADLGPDEVLAIAYLTRIPDESYTAYIEQIGRDYAPGEIPRRPSAPRLLAREVKLADLRDNLSRMPETPNPGEGEDGWLTPTRPEWASLKARYEKAIETLEAKE